MKAIFLTKYGNSATAFETRETDIPIIGKDDVLIKVHTFGLNFADVVARRGLYPDAPKNPAVLGYDVAGTVHAVGENVKNFKIGQRVAALTIFGGYAEYVKTMREAVVAIPDSMDYATATALSVQGCTAYFCAYESVRLHEGDKVLVHAAAGGVGSFLVQMAKHEKCVVYGTASSSKMDYLKSIGVDVPIDYTKQDFTDILKSQSVKMDVVFDSLGGKIFRKSYKSLNSGGRIVNFGLAEQIQGNKTNIFKSISVLLRLGFYSPIQFLMKSNAMIGVNMLRIAYDRPHLFENCFKEVMKMAEQGIIKPTVGKIFKASEIAQAHDYLENRQSIGKIVIEMN